MPYLVLSCLVFSPHFSSSVMLFFRVSYWLVLSFVVLFFLVLSYLVFFFSALPFSFLLWSCLVFFCLVLSCLVLCCLGLARLISILSCLVSVVWLKNLLDWSCRQDTLTQFLEWKKTWNDSAKQSKKGMPFTGRRRPDKTRTRTRARAKVKNHNIQDQRTETKQGQGQKRQVMKDMTSQVKTWQDKTNYLPPRQSLSLSLSCHCLCLSLSCSCLVICSCFVLFGLVLGLKNPTVAWRWCNQRQKNGRPLWQCVLWKNRGLILPCLDLSCVVWSCVVFFCVVLSSFCLVPSCLVLRGLSFSSFDVVLPCVVLSCLLCCVV